MNMMKNLISRYVFNSSLKNLKDNNNYVDKIRKVN